MTVFETLRDSVADEWERLLAHPFVSSMADGTLRPETFRFYLRQDDYYLDVLLRCMGAFVSRAPDRPARRLGVRLLAGTLSGELEMHDDLIGRDATEGLEVCDAALAYEAFLLRIAMEGDATAILVSMTPCIASYREIAARYDEAVGLYAVANSIPFVGPLTIDGEVKRFLFCGEPVPPAKVGADTTPGSIPPPCVPLPPASLQIATISQNLLSILLVFFIGLALRNYFRVK